ETFRVAASGHQAPGERHDSRHVCFWPADGLLQRFELEVRHDRPLGGHRACAGQETDADGDRDQAREPGHGTHSTYSVNTVGYRTVVSTQKELTTARRSVYRRWRAVSRYLF